MPDWVTGLSFVGSTAVALVAGYLLGFQHGRVIGELRTLKSTMAYYRGRRSSRHEGQFEAEAEREAASAM